ncbi:MAG: hypothetical protein O7G87_21725 [bacterium]|nr:hypothetical protein [bacterium]
MVRRARTYSDPRVIDLLNEKFVPAAININGLQRQDDEEGRFFRLISWQGRYKKSFEEAMRQRFQTDHGLCHQGQFVTTVEGELLGSRHTADVEQLLDMLHQALENWETRSTQRGVTEMDAVERDERFVWEYPEDGLVLHIGCCDLPRAVDRREPERRNDHNQDFLWMTQEEMLAIVPEGVETGDRFPLPESVHWRLVRYHLLDSVRGETNAWPVEAPRDITIELEATAVDEDRVELEIHGSGTLSQLGDWCIGAPRQSVYQREEMCCLIQERGFDTELLGYATLDRRTKRFTAFDLLAVGTRWGGTRYNVRSNDTEPAPLGIAMTIAGTETLDRTPPHASPRSYFDA